MSRAFIFKLAGRALCWTAPIVLVLVSILWCASYPDGLGASRVYAGSTLSIFAMRGRICVQQNHFNAHAPPPALWSYFRFSSGVADEILTYKSGPLGFSRVQYLSPNFSGVMTVIPIWWIWILAALLSAPVARDILRWRKARHFLRRGLCPACGYDLRATPDRCPECGCVVYQPVSEIDD